MAMTETAPPAKRPRGRPTVYDEAQATECLARMSAGQTLREICRDDHMPSESTVREWVLDDRNGFAARHARARELQLEAWADEINEIGDDATNDWMDRQCRDGSTERVLDNEHVQRSKLRIDTKKWLLARLLPKRYGDRTAIEHSGSITTGLADRLDQARKRDE